MCSTAQGPSVNLVLRVAGRARRTRGDNKPTIGSTCLCADSPIDLRVQGTTLYRSSTQASKNTNCRAFYIASLVRDSGAPQGTQGQADGCNGMSMVPASVRLFPYTHSPLCCPHVCSTQPSPCRVSSLDTSFFVSNDVCPQNQTPAIAESHPH